MNKLEQLIKDLSPNGIKIRSLEDCCIIHDNKRKPITKGQRVAGEYPYYGANGIQDYVENYIFDGSFVLVGEDGSVITDRGTPVVTWAQGKIWVNNHAHIISEKEDVLLRYLYHYLQIIDVTPLIHGNIPKLTGSGFRNLKIYVPPLPVQAEIVRILDNFTEFTDKLTMELENELVDRRKQYKYYRDKLLWFEDDTPLKTLPELSENCDRQRKPITKENRENGQYPYYGASGIVDYVSDYIFDGDYLLVSEDGANLMARSTPIAFSISEKNWVNNHAHVLKFDTYEMRRYVEFYLNSIDLTQYISGGAQPKLNQENLNKILIPIPQFSQVKKIVGILDHFDKLCNDITDSLPAEIAARQKQYEYYRDKLLTFKELT